MNFIPTNKTIKNLKQKSLKLIDIYGLELGLIKREFKIKALIPFFNKSKNKFSLLNKVTKKELYEKARRKNISGRSTMDKQELINALKSA